MRVDVKDIFRDYDRLRSGKILKTKFASGLNMLKLHLSPGEVEVLQDYYEVQGQTDMVRIARFTNDIESAFVTKGLLNDPTAVPTEYKSATPKFKLGILTADEQAELKTLLDQLSLVTHKNRVLLRRFFADNDHGVKGRCKQSEFRSILAVINVNLNKRQLDLVTQRFGIDHFGTKLDINYSAFCDEVEALTIRRTNEFTSLMDRMRKQLRKRGARGIHGLATIFRRMDSYDRNRQLDKQEFVEGLRDFGLQVTKKEAMQLMKAYDRNNDGVISYDEFLRGMRGALNSRRAKMVQKAFKKLDKDGSGRITLSDLKGTFNASHHPKVISGEIKEADALQLFLNSFDGSQPKDKGAGNDITIDEFEDYYSNISASIDDDEYFVKMMEKVWDIDELNFEEL